MDEWLLIQPRAWLLWAKIYNFKFVYKEDWKHRLWWDMLEWAPGWSICANSIVQVWRECHQTLFAVVGDDGKF